MQNENFAVLSERFSAREKSLGRNDSFLFFKLNYENFELRVREKERKMPQKAGATEECHETKEKAAAVQTRNKVPFFCYSVSFSLFLLVSFCWCFSGSKHWSSCWKGEAKERIVAAKDETTKSWKVCAIFGLKHHCLKRVKGRCSFSSVYCVLRGEWDCRGVFRGCGALGISNKKGCGCKKMDFSFTEWFNLFFYKYFLNVK